jgi:hypothetical protein
MFVQLLLTSLVRGSTRASFCTWKGRIEPHARDEICMGYDVDGRR